MPPPGESEAMETCNKATRTPVRPCDKPWLWVCTGFLKLVGGNHALACIHSVYTSM